MHTSNRNFLNFERSDETRAEPIGGGIAGFRVKNHTIGDGITYVVFQGP